MGFQNDVSFSEFCSVLKQEMKFRFAEDSCIEIHKVTKNNSMEYDCMLIRDAKETVAPNFYLQDYYEEYKTGRTLEDIAAELETMYYHSRNKVKELDTDLSFSGCRNKIIYRLVSQKMNEELKHSIPYVCFLDLMITFHIMLCQDEEGVAMIRVTNVLMEQWEVDKEMLLKLAQNNTKELFPGNVCSMYALLRDGGETSAGDNFFQDAFAENSAPVVEPMVITNERYVNGAAAVLYPNMLRRVAKLFQGDYYLIPSSVHEMLAVPANAITAEHELLMMVAQVNESCVQEEEILSNAVYRYWSQSRILKIVG
ncbi:MAG: DUF5688 family protein [Clostridiaceae bacterium]|nr:DUF5688 family protein [Clostridiaceae bacterium]